MKEEPEMRKKVLWVFLTLLTVIALVLTSCGTETEEEQEGPTIIHGVLTLPPERQVQQDTQVYTEKPKYGGIAVGFSAADVPGFDEAFIQHYAAGTLKLTNEEMLQGDWAKGPAGTGEFDFLIAGINLMSSKAGALADSWEIPTKGVIIFHIREGVHWHNKPPTNGREITVEDVVYSFKRMCTNPGAYIKITYPTLAKNVIITGDEAARTVTVDSTPCPPDQWANTITLFPDYLSIMPKDALEYYNNDMNDWRKSIGTGPFILTDYVANGSVTYTRNDKYWMTNPVGPGKGDQLPYLSGVKTLIITDVATALTAFRTKKINGYTGQYDDVKEFLDNPDLKQMFYTIESCGAIFMRTDKADLPLSKLEVRQALMLATDFNKIKDEFYDGKATILGWPIAYVKEYKDAYVPMEELPASTQELFSHNVNKAKDLLAAAGYPTGITTSVTFNNSSQTTVDYLSLIASMWAEAGITLKLDGRDYNTWVARIRARNYDNMLYYASSGVSNILKMLNITGTSTWNQSYVNDARVNEVMTANMELIGYDEEQLQKNWAELVPYVIEQSWVIPTPCPYYYTLWWPWVKNWNGELSMGYYNGSSYLKYEWMDLELKNKIMSGK